MKSFPSKWRRTTDKISQINNGSTILILVFLFFIQCTQTITLYFCVETGHGHRTHSLHTSHSQIKPRLTPSSTEQTSKNKQQKRNKNKAWSCITFSVLADNTTPQDIVALKCTQWIKISHSQHIKVSNSDCKHMILPLFCCCWLVNITLETMDQPKTKR